ncbi:LAMI_0H08614g1_1 [Lachancea mirantina]|uniref:ER membrane protein complex subunit 6 n=1 Tax=Lachancea mirantina TaxID=1230905 RepID=A0A1G4KG52_9SACH|nr:LAMI_0H08614g1_1 [Lachancea mirantina]
MNAQEVFANVNSQESINFNRKRLLYIQDITSLVFGCGAGILQLENLEGFGAFFGSYLAISLVFVVWYCGLKPGKYYQSPIQEILVDSLFRELAGYVMAWTFVYALLG